MRLVALILLLSAFSSLTLTEVVQNFNEQNCGEFFIRNGNVRVIPTIFTGHQYKKICQRWNNIYRFATVYDTVRRIPVYSAYTFTQQAVTRRPEDADWKFEPQLENIQGYNGMREMTVCPRRGDIIIRNIEKQAVDSDYSDTIYTKGHVFPALFAADHDHAVSTFTLTNAAPQLGGDNGNWSDKVEQPMRREINANCRPNQNRPAYIVTGVIPGNRMVNITRGDEVKQITVPSHFWSAYCCRNNAGALVSGTYIAEQGRPNVRRSAMARLNEELTRLYGQGFSVFPGLNC